MTERRVCACRAILESETDEESLSHTLRIHYAEPEHQEFVAAAELVEELVPAVDVPVRRTWIGVTAGLRRVS